MNRDIIRKALWYLAMGFMAFFVLFPIYLIFLVAFAPPAEIFRPNPALIPSSLNPYSLYVVLKYYHFLSHFILSLETAFIVSGICIALGAPAAYTISRMPRRASYLVIVFLFVTQMIPEIQIGVPLASAMAKLHLLNTSLGIALAQSSIALPLVTYVLVGAFRSIPTRLSESAQIDGASKLQAFFYIDLQLALTGIFVAVILAWLFSWDEFILAQLISPLHTTIPVLIYQNIARGQGGLPADDAFSLIMTIPVVALVLILQKYMRSNIIAGALK
ncbi:MAG: carbohydrate ABC transporter permease [Thermoplasmataceae archaeon]